MFFSAYLDSCLHKNPPLAKNASSSSRNPLGWCSAFHPHPRTCRLWRTSTRRQGTGSLRSRHVRSDDTCSEKLGASPVVARLPTHLVARARADVSAFRLYTPPERSNSIRPLFLPLKNVPPELRNTMMLPLSATCPAEMNESCTRVVSGAILQSPDTLTPARLRMKICVRPVLVHLHPVDDLSSHTIFAGFCFPGCQADTAGTRMWPLQNQSGTRFRLLRDSSQREHSVSIIGCCLAATGLEWHQHSWHQGFCLAGGASRGFQRCRVCTALGGVVPPTALLHVIQSSAQETLPRELPSHYRVVFAFSCVAFANLVILTFAFAVLVANVFALPVARTLLHAFCRASTGPSIRILINVLGPTEVAKHRPDLRVALQDLQVQMAVVLH